MWCAPTHPAYGNCWSARKHPDWRTLNVQIFRCEAAGQRYKRWSVEINCLTALWPSTETLNRRRFKSHKAATGTDIFTVVQRCGSVVDKPTVLKPNYSEMQLNGFLFAFSIQSVWAQHLWLLPTQNNKHFRRLWTGFFFMSLYPVRQ